jgi:hypothetical protein
LAEQLEHDAALRERQLQGDASVHLADAGPADQNHGAEPDRTPDQEILVDL